MTRGNIMIYFLLFVMVAYVGVVYGQEDVKDEKKIPIIILAGQSNMRGVKVKDNIDLLPEELKLQENVLFAEYWGKELKALSPKNNIGPEISFGNALLGKEFEKIGLIKMSYGGTSLLKHWNPDPKVFDQKEGIGTLHKRLIEYIKSIQATHSNIEFVGMIWMQGEADSRYGKITDKEYGDKLKEFIESCRSACGQPNLPFVCGRINPPVSWPNRESVRKAQETLDCKNYDWVDCDDIEKGSDDLHFTCNGQIELGKRFASKMLKLLKENKND